MNKRLANVSISALLAAWLIAGAAGCSMLDKPSANITGVKLQDVGLAEATLVFDVEVNNPYAVSLPLSNLNYTLSSGGQSFLTGEAKSLGVIPARASKTLALPLQIDYRQVQASYRRLRDAVQSAQPGDAIPYTADFVLWAEAPILGPIQLPMSRDGELTIPTGAGLLEKVRDWAR
jgi:LEA14-like dessication related protein